MASEYAWIKEGEVYNASMDEMENPEELLQKLTVKFKNKAVKVIPPREYKPTVKSEEEILKTPLKDVYNQTVSKLCDGYYHFKKGTSPRNKFTTVQDLKDGGGRPKHLQNAEFEEVEKEAWRGVRQTGSEKTKYKHLCIYGSDEEGTFMAYGSKQVTLADFPSTLKKVLTRYQSGIMGLTSPMTYFGRWKSFFVDHKEDLDLAAFNYLHLGEPKVWYTRDADEAVKFEESSKVDLKEVLRKDFHSCETPFRDKGILVDLTAMKRNGVKVFRHIQKEGELMYVPPGAFHSGWNMGFNVAESVNVGNKDWIPWGLLAKTCDKSYKPLLKMEFFVYEHMFEKYQKYISGTLELMNPATGKLETVPPPPRDFPDENLDIVKSSPLDSILAVKVVESVRMCYVSVPGYKVWLDEYDVKKMTWNLTGKPVVIPEDFFESINNAPSDFLTAQGRLHRNIIPGGPVNFDASLVKVDVHPLECVQASSSTRKCVKRPRLPEPSPTPTNLEVCPVCKKDLSGFHRIYEKQRHIFTCENQIKIPCQECNSTFTRESDLKLHIIRKH